MMRNLSKLVPRRSFLALGGASILTGCVTDGVTFPSIPGSVGALSEADAAAGIRAALNNGVAQAISTIGVRNGFLRNPQIRIPLPGFLQDMQSSLSRFGLSGPLDTLETQLNRGAETAVPRARSIFVNAISSMNINDAIGVVRGGENAATNYLKNRTFTPLTNLFTPIMSNALQEAGAIRTFDSLTARLKSIPLAPQLGADAKNDLIRHGVQYGLDGMFLYIAKEEAAIRANPAKRTSEILRRVFG
ncbi:DUF4197 domain-containing protein [Hyphococcus flavus]|uniref:DUF4197 domain-containing protein n=1 Tax=Hyphococcus flavus TaxID=1866326 RepID=A0AAF0CE94_9PROT|nr:DUF4197 domain-containing protein [Hyphococcus flavus]WDI30926.1 DUF4197 domain-containing protein [Hyphococcus flavus]